MNRREFAKTAGVGIAVLAYAPLTLSGCDLISDLEAWVPVGIASLNSIESVLTANGYPLAGPALTAFNDTIAALNLVLSSAKAYAATTPAPVGTLQALQAAIAAVTSNLAAFLSALAIPGGGLLNVIIGIAQIVISTIMAFANQLPATTGAATAHTSIVAATWRASNSEFSVSAKHRTKKQFKTDHNSVLAVGAKAGVVIPANAKLSLSLMEHF